MVPRAAVLLIAGLAALAWFVRGDVAEYAAFKQLTDTDDRQRRYRAWIVKGFLLFTGGSVIGLAVMGRLSALWALPLEFAPLSHAAGAALPPRLLGGGFTVGLIGGLFGAGLIVGVAAARRGNKTAGVALGDIQPLMPRNWAETAHAAALSVNAGLSEELFFRLLIPLLLTALIGNALYAFVAAAAVFGLIHLYQGWVGVLATTLVGLVLTALYLWTGSIWAAVAAHAALDLFGLVVRPTFARLLWGHGRET